MPVAMGTTQSALTSWQTALMLRANLALTSQPARVKIPVNLDFTMTSRYRAALPEYEDTTWQRCDV